MRWSTYPARRRVAVLGVMAEITDAEAEHLAIRRYATARGIEVIAVGTDLYGVAPVDDPVGRWVRSATATRCS